MHKRGLYKIKVNEALTQTVFKMVLEGDTQYFTAPGQFVNVELEGKFLRRPISVCDYDQSTLTIIYKVVGEGTAQMAEMSAGETLDLLTGLGNGFGIDNSACKPLLVGGGVGVPPLYNLAKKLIEQGKQVTVVLGFNIADEIFYVEDFEALGADVVIATADGSHGIKGFVTDAIITGEISYDYVYACGPGGMLRALSGIITTKGEFSFEERMGCGFGGCMGCTCKTKSGNKRICVEGPVLSTDEIIW